MVLVGGNRQGLPEDERRAEDGGFDRRLMKAVDFDQLKGEDSLGARRDLVERPRCDLGGVQSRAGEFPSSPPFFKCS